MACQSNPLSRVLLLHRCGIYRNRHSFLAMNDQHAIAADEVWNAFPPYLASKMNYDVFVLGFKLGRVSMKACFDKAELLRPDDEPKPFTPPTE